LFIVEEREILYVGGNVDGQSEEIGIEGDENG
jgi:hypothetical protein